MKAYHENVANGDDALNITWDEMSSRAIPKQCMAALFCSRSEKQVT